MRPARWVAIATCAAALVLPGVSAAAPGPVATSWQSLLPPDWDPQQVLAGFALDRLDDGDPAAEAVLTKLRVVFDAAPANPRMDQQTVRIWGYLMPLEVDRDQIREFLLVPYFGACVHEPAPPANQVIRVVPALPLAQADRGTSAVWVTGRLSLDRMRSKLGVAAYRINAERVEAYKP